MPNYKVFTYDEKEGVKVIKVGSTYAGKPVWGVAKCAPGDTYDYDYGYRLAKARCDMKIAEKRYNRAAKKFSYVNGLRMQANLLYDDASAYVADSWKAYTENINNLVSICNEKSNT